MNGNKWAIEVLKLEGLSEELDIAEIKEVLKCAVEVLKRGPVSYRGATVRYIPKAKKSAKAR